MMQGQQDPELEKIQQQLQQQFGMLKISFGSSKGQADGIINDALSELVTKVATLTIGQATEKHIIAKKLKDMEKELKDANALLEKYKTQFGEIRATKVEMGTTEKPTAQTESASQTPS